LYNSNQKMTE